MSATAVRLEIAHAVVHEGRRRRRTRSTAVSLVLTLLVVVLGGLGLVLGDLPLSLREVLVALAGTDDSGARFVVVGLRLPRIALGLLVGLALGLAGALFQTVLGNPLASPDVIGISQGASAGAVAALLVGGATGLPVSLAALAGGSTVGLVLYAVAWRGGLAGHRVVLAGIGVAYACTAVVGYLLTRSEVQQAQQALLWMTGSLAQASWPVVRLLAVAVAVLVPLVVLVARRLDLLVLGDDQARSLGLRPDLARAAVVALGVALACVATAAAGPVAFVALLAAPVARGLLRDGGAALLPSALVGAVVVVAADLVAQHLLPTGLSLPVGVVTGAVGGAYLIWLISTGGTRRP